jgi:hypothetical protein
MSFGNLLVCKLRHSSSYALTPSQASLAVGVVAPCNELETAATISLV